MILHALVDGAAGHTGTAIVDAVRWPLTLCSAPFSDTHARGNVRHVPRRVHIQLADAAVLAVVYARIVVTDVHFAVLATILIGTVADRFTAHLQTVTGVATDVMLTRSR